MGGGGGAWGREGESTQRSLTLSPSGEMWARASQPPGHGDMLHRGSCGA